VDRQQGGAQALAEHGLALHAVFTLRGVLGVLLRDRRISEQQHAHVMEYLNGEAC
jgi:orotate phosphoribosyltransferase